MAQPPTIQTGPSIEDAFIADRARFWSRFTGFTKWSVIVVVAVLIVVWLIFG